MATAGRRRGRRDNGLDAPDWRAIEDLDPRTSEEVLDALAARGIAAYVQPAIDVDPVTRSTTLPDRPRDRLYVDRAQTDAARACVRELLADTVGSDLPGDGPAANPGSPATSGDLDTRFAEIVAGFDRPVDTVTTIWPAAENVTSPLGPDPTRNPDPGREVEPQPSREATREPGPELEPRLVDGRSVAEPTLLDALDALDAQARDEAERDDEPPELYEPPPPPPLPQFPRPAVLGALAVLVGLLMVIGRPSVLPLDRQSTMLLGFAVMLGGAAALISLLRPGADPDDTTHPNDGAQV